MLPPAFARGSGACAGRRCAVSHSRRGVDGRGDCVAGNVCSCHRLAGGTCGRPSSLMLQCTAGCGMGIQRCLAYIGHPEDPARHPGATCSNRESRAIVVGELRLEQWQDPLGTVAGPGCNSSVAGGSGKVGNLPIETGFDQLGCVHVASHILPIRVERVRLREGSGGNTPSACRASLQCGLTATLRVTPCKPITW